MIKNTKEMEQSADMKTFYVSGHDIYENNGDPRRNRLVIRAHPNGKLSEGPGLGDEALDLVTAVPTQLIVKAQENARKEAQAHGTT
jgi:hypothetical protein